MVFVSITLSTLLSPVFETSVFTLPSLETVVVGSVFDGAFVVCVVLVVEIPKIFFFAYSST